MKIKVGKLVREINRYDNTVYSELYIVVSKLAEGLWTVALVSDPDYTRVFHTKMLQVVKCK